MVCDPNGTQNFDIFAYATHNKLRLRRQVAFTRAHTLSMVLRQRIARSQNLLYKAN